MQYSTICTTCVSVFYPLLVACWLVALLLVGDAFCPDPSQGGCVVSGQRNKTVRARGGLAKVQISGHLFSCDDEHIVQRSWPEHTARMDAFGGEAEAQPADPVADAGFASAVNRDGRGQRHL